MRGITTALVVLIVMTAIGLLVIPRLANWTVLVVLSGSMEPVMPTGGLALVEPVDAAAIKVGDVVTYPIPNHPGALVSHRVTAIEFDSGVPVLLTKGDANESPDGWRTPTSSVKGRVAVTVPYLGLASQLMRTPGGFLLVLIVPAAVIILGEVGTIARELRRMRQKEIDT
jgi:signal peptidase